MAAVVVNYSDNSNNMVPPPPRPSTLSILGASSYPHGDPLGRSHGYPHVAFRKPERLSSSPKVPQPGSVGRSLYRSPGLPLCHFNYFIELDLLVSQMGKLRPTGWRQLASPQESFIFTSSFAGRRVMEGYHPGPSWALEGEGPGRESQLRPKQVTSPLRASVSHL